MIESEKMISIGNQCRLKYLNGLDQLIENLTEKAANRRNTYITDIFNNTEQYRKDFAKLLGYPLNTARNEKVFVIKEYLSEYEDAKLYRMCFLIEGCVPVYGLLFVKDEIIKKPLVVAAHGGYGTPEVLAGIVEKGSDGYHNMIKRLLKLGANVYAPQFLLWDTEEYKTGISEVDDSHIGETRRQYDQRLKQLGSSVAAMEIAGIMYALDYFEKQPFVDPKRIGMSGFSYGGFYTLHAAALEPRIKSALSAGWFHSRYAGRTADYVWKDSANYFLDAEILALIYPRKIFLAMGNEDGCFGSEGMIKEYARFQKIAGDKGDYVSFHLFDGIHEFIREDDSLMDDMMKALEEE